MAFTSLVQRKSITKFDKNVLNDIRVQQSSIHKRYCDYKAQKSIVSKRLPRRYTLRRFSLENSFSYRYMPLLCSNTIIYLYSGYIISQSNVDTNYMSLSRIFTFTAQRTLHWIFSESSPVATCITEIGLKRLCLTKCITKLLKVSFRLIPLSMVYNFQNFFSTCFLF